MPRRRADDEGADGGMQVITRAAAILGALAEPEGGGRSLAQLAAQTGLPKTTVHRICAALEQVGYVHTDAATGRRSSDQACCAWRWWAAAT